ncbi:MAG: TonB C-terminal domain-containing protein, partial [Thiothrix litoralis]
DLGNARAAWTSAIKRKVKGNWNKPSQSFGMSATARVSVRNGGSIGRFSLNCDGSPAYCDSLKAAIHGSDPFPKPEYSELYGDTLVITF